MTNLIYLYTSTLKSAEQAMHRDILVKVYPRYRLLGALPQTPGQIHFLSNTFICVAFILGTLPTIKIFDITEKVLYRIQNMSLSKTPQTKIYNKSGRIYHLQHTW